MKVYIIEEKCVGCRQCVKSCLYGAIEIINKKAVINDKCVNCGSCLSSCKFGAIAYEGTIKETKKTDFSSYKGVMVIAEQDHGQLKHVSLELLGKAKELGEKLGEPCYVTVLGHKISKIAKNILEYGPDKVFALDNPLLDNYQTDVYLKSVVTLLKEIKPAIVIFGATNNGRDLAPRVASKLYCGLTADCTELDIDKDEKILLQTRPAFGGNIMATIISPNHRPQMATVRPKVMKMPEKVNNIKGEIIDYKVSLDKKDLRTKIKKIVRNTSHHVNLEDAQVVVAFGRGIGDKSNIALIEKLSKVLNAEIGASRAVVDKGYIDKEHQIGQTGKTVRPKLYIACGISGAIQHIAGMSSSELIIAINTDPQAPILDIASYAIVGDLKKIIPALTEEFSTYLKETA